VERYGYYFLFVMNLPKNIDKIWDPENVDDLQLMPVKETRKKEKENKLLRVHGRVSNDTSSTCGTWCH
jgi:hypothetical protein